MNKYLIILLFFSLLSVTPTSAESVTAMEVLDFAAAKVRKDGGLKVEYAIKADGKTESGTLSMQGSKFHCTMPGLMTWYDGKTLWSYVTANEEVNVSEPSSSEVAKINPYAFLSIYKKGYTAKFGKSTADCYEVVLTAQNAKTSITSMIIRVSRKDKQIKYTKLTNSRNGSAEISVKSYRKGQKFTASSFRFDKKKYPQAEVIDLR